MVTETKVVAGVTEETVDLLPRYLLYFVNFYVCPTVNILQEKFSAQFSNEIKLSATVKLNV